MTAALPLSIPDAFDLECAIGEIIAARLPGMREEDRRAMCRQVEREEFADFVALDRERRGVA